MYLIGIYPGTNCDQVCSRKSSNDFWRSCDLHSCVEDMTEGELITFAASLVFDGCIFSMPLIKDAYTVQMLSLPGCTFKVIEGGSEEKIAELVYEFQTWKEIDPENFCLLDVVKGYLSNCSRDTHGYVDEALDEAREVIEELDLKMVRTIGSNAEENATRLKELFMSPESVYQFS